MARRSTTAKTKRAKTKTTATRATRTTQAPKPREPRVRQSLIDQALDEVHRLSTERQQLVDRLREAEEIQNRQQATIRALERQRDRDAITGTHYRRVVRQVVIEGDPAWVAQTLANSLPAGRRVFDGRAASLKAITVTQVDDQSVQRAPGGGRMEPFGDGAPRHAGGRQMREDARETHGG